MALRDPYGRVRALALVALAVALLIATPSPATAQTEVDTRTPRVPVECSDYEDPMYVSVSREFAPDDPGARSPRAALARFFAEQTSQMRRQDASSYRETPPVRGSSTLVKEEGGRIRASAEARQDGEAWRLVHYEACIGLVKGENPAPSEESNTPTPLMVVLPALGLTSAMALRKRAGLIALVVALLVSASAFAPPQVAAHCAGGDCGDDWYPAEWKADHHTGLNLTWRFTDGFPAAGKRDRTIEAFHKWNALGQKMQFERLPDVPNYSFTLCESPYHGIHWRDISPFAEAWKCIHDVAFSSDDVLHTFNIEFDSSRNWFGWDDKSLIDGSEFDFESVATHEVGHVTGFTGRYADGHFDPNGDLCPATEASHTMCPSVVQGSTGWRSLEEHDSHTFQNAYPDA